MYGKQENIEEPKRRNVSLQSVQNYEERLTVEEECP
jgi:hypothetical protein